MSLPFIFFIIIVHWIGDFVLQSEQEAMNKSHNIFWLLRHTFRYTIFWEIALLVLIVINFHHPFFVYIPWSFTKFLAITFICHTITDYYTSKLNKKLWEQKRVHDFFVMVGFDQLLHYIQLFLTFKYIFL